MSDRIDVLDQGHVRLVDHMGDDLSVVRAARVSHDAAWRTGEDAGKDEKLIRYLWKNHHVSPFEHVTFTFEVKAPVFVFRQWHRHRTWSFNEVSARYTELPEEFYVPNPKDIGVQSIGNKQGRVTGEGPDRGRQAYRYQSTCQAAFREYHELLADGWPRELARMVLPLSTYSTMFATVDLRNLLHFLELRTDPHSQWEIQQYAFAMFDLIEPIVPVCIKAWADTGR
jgi:thymidylate synthase (FAD)